MMSGMGMMGGMGMLWMVLVPVFWMALGAVLAWYVLRVRSTTRTAPVAEATPNRDPAQL